MGLEPCFVLPTWTQLVSGGWADRWDISVASMTITPERLQALYFAQPYYTTPAAFFIHKDNTTFKQASDLSGKRIGVCVGCTYEAFIKGTLVMPGQKVDFVVQNATATGYDIENSAIDDLSKGDGVQLDAVLTGIPLGQDMIKSGKPIKQLGEPVFIEYLGVAIDKKSNKDSVSLAKKVNEIIQQMHSDGTLLRLSQQYYGQDLTTAAGKFDLQSLNQFP
jgi:polar amino acid transport system substrate-binding protein